MKGFHSTLSRRDFMKGLGLAGMGISTATAAVPSFRDLDEISSYKNDSLKRPWWIKEVDKITTEVDWQRMQRFQKHKYNNFNAHLPEEEATQIRATARTEMQRRMANNDTPGWTLRDLAVKSAGWYGVRYRLGQGVQYLMDMVGPPATEPFENQNAVPLGVPKWNGTPEENSKMLTNVLRFFGASSVGFVELNEQNKKMIWTNLPFAPFPSVQLDTDDAIPNFDMSTKSVKLPNKIQYAVVFTVRQSLDMFKRPGWISDGAAGAAYDNCDIIQYRLKSFLYTIGYNCFLQSLQGNGPIAGWGTLSGLGELGRLQHLITPEWGPMIRESVMVLMDLPVAPTKPVDFGASRFCINCSKCSDACPSGALKGEKEPSWETTPKYNDDIQPQLFNNPGIKSWYFDHFKCNKYWQETDSFCGFCNAVCVFSKEDFASIHDVVKGVVAKTKLFDGFFVEMDKMFDYGLYPAEEVENWWGENQPVHGIHYENDPFFN